MSEEVTHEGTLEQWAALCFFASMGMLAKSRLAPPKWNDEDRNRLLAEALPLLRKIGTGK